MAKQQRREFEGATLSLREVAPEELQNLLQSEARYRDLFEHTPTPTIEADWSGVQQELCRLKAQGVTDLASYFKRHPSEVSRLREKIVRYGISKSVLALYRAKSHAEFERYVALEVGSFDRFEIYAGAIVAFDSGKRYFESEGKEIAADGAQIFTSTRFQLPPGSSKDWNRVLVTIEDLTERERIEERVRENQKIEAIGIVAGGVAHEFNNILAIIQGCSELLSETSGENAELVQHIVEATQRGADLTHGLLAYARQQNLRSEFVDLEQIIGSVRRAFEQKYGQVVTVTESVSKDLWRIQSDPYELKIALLNLALNAGDAMPYGGALRISCKNVSLEEPHVTHQSGLLPGDYVLIAVTDTGSGMSETVRSQALDPFFSTKGVGNGCGLGLSMVDGFARQSGGRVALFSSPGKGTTVRLYLPRQIG